MLNKTLSSFLCVQGLIFSSTGAKRGAQRQHWNLGVRGLTTIQQGFDFIVHLRYEVDCGDLCDIFVCAFETIQSCVAVGVSANHRFRASKRSHVPAAKSVDHISTLWVWQNTWQTDLPFSRRWNCWIVWNQLEPAIWPRWPHDDFQYCVASFEVPIEEDRLVRFEFGHATPPIHTHGHALTPFVNRCAQNRTDMHRYDITAYLLYMYSGVIDSTSVLSYFVIYPGNQMCDFQTGRLQSRFGFFSRLGRHSWDSCPALWRRWRGHLINARPWPHLWKMRSGKYILYIYTVYKCL